MRGEDGEEERGEVRKGGVNEGVKDCRRRVAEVRRKGGGEGKRCR